MTSPIRSLALASALLAVLAACSKPEQPQMPPPEVVVMTATPKDVPLQRDLVGRLSPYRSSDVRARVAGVVQKRVYQEGSDVKEGQVLFLIDPAPLQASLSAAQANLASAQATYANAKVAADRARQLAPQKFVSKSDLDNAEAAERSAAAAVQQARANVETARINLGYASVTAPIAGRAGKQQVTEGALVGQGDTTLLPTINQIDPLYANISMSSSELPAIQQAQGGGRRFARLDALVQVHAHDAVTSQNEPHSRITAFLIGRLGLVERGPGAGVGHAGRAVGGGGVVGHLWPLPDYPARHAAQLGRHGAEVGAQHGPRH